MSLFNGSEKYGSDIKIGERYRDPQTGIAGTVVAIAFYQYACERATIECVIRDKIEEYTFDAPRLEHVETKQRAKAQRTGGPRDGVPQAKAVPR